jgi:hypothetical protein
MFIAARKSLYRQALNERYPHPKKVTARACVFSPLQQLHIVEDVNELSIFCGPAAQRKRRRNCLLTSNPPPKRLKKHAQSSLHADALFLSTSAAGYS